MAQTPGKLLARLRERRPLVHCITNYVAMNISANVLLSVGASPAMVHAEEEAGEFASISNALTINIGTLSSPWLRAMESAAQTANAAGIPWVLDPVAHFATHFRQQAVTRLVDLKPKIIRGNASEILALAGHATSGKGVDSGDGMERARDAAIELAQNLGAVIAVTGERDILTDGLRTEVISGGSVWMPQVTALGCSLTCLVGAFAAVAEGDQFSATRAALTLFSVAGEIAQDRANGPGSFSWRFLDALAVLTPDELDHAGKVTDR